MFKLKSDSPFAEFLKNGGGARLPLLIFLGIALILIGRVGAESKEAAAVSTEERTAEICSLMEGVGECRVMITYEPDSEERVYGVLVLCDGADSPAVRQRITNSLSALLGIGTNRIEIQRLNR